MIIEYLSTLTLQYSNSVINDQLIIITMVEVECTATIPYYSAASLSNFCKKKKNLSFLTTEPCRYSVYHRPSDGLPIVFAFHLELPSLLDNHQVDDFLLPFVPNFVLNFPFSSNTCTRWFNASQTIRCPALLTDKQQGSLNFPSPSLFFANPYQNVSSLSCTLTQCSVTEHQQEPITASIIIECGENER